MRSGQRFKASWIVLTAVIAGARLSADSRFIRGDIDQSGAPVNLADSLIVFGHLFQSVSDKVLACLDAADVNDDSRIDLSDGVYLLIFLFQGGAPLPPPYPVCGCDPTEDDPYDCAQYRECPLVESEPSGFVTVHGRVVDRDGKGIHLAEVSVGSGGDANSERTDGDGYFSTQLLPRFFDPEGSVLLNASLDGFTRKESFINFTGECIYDRDMTLLQLKKKEVEKLEAGEVMSLTDQEEGELPRGAVDIPGAAIPTDNRGHPMRLEFVSLVDLSGEELRTFPDRNVLVGPEFHEIIAACEVRLTDLDTNDAIDQLADTSVILLRVPDDVPTSESVFIWAYDGGWFPVDDNRGTVYVTTANGHKQAVIETSHFTWIVVTRVISPACIRATFLREGGQQVLTNLNIAAEGRDYGGVFEGELTGFEGADGKTYSFRVKSDAEVIFRVSYDGQTYYLEDRGGMYGLVRDRERATPFPAPEENECGDPQQKVLEIMLEINRPPVVKIVADKLQACPGQEVRLVARASDLDGDGPVEVEWSAPDGGRFSDRSSRKGWIAPETLGTYRIVAVVTDTLGVSTGREIEVEVTEACCPEIRRVRAESVTHVDPRTRPVLQLSADALSEEPLTFTWSGPGLDGVTGNPVAWRVQGAGPERIRVRASTGRCSVEASLSVVVLNERPEIVRLTPAFPAGCATVCCGGPVELTVDAQDPDGDSLSYRWSASGGVIDDVNGPVSTWKAPDFGTYRITVEVEDPFLGRTSHTVSLAVDNNLPEVRSLTALPDAEARTNEQVFLSAQGSDFRGRVAGFAWSTTGGTLVVSPNAPHSATFQAAEPGTYIVTVTVTDNCGSTAEESIEITVTRAVLENLVINGDFEAGFTDDGTGDLVPDGWQKAEGRPEEGATLSRVAGHQGGSAVRWARPNGGSTGDHLLIQQALDIDVAAYDALELSLDVYVSFHDLAAGGSLSPATEWPTRVQINYLTTGGEVQVWRFGWYLDPPGDGRVLDPGTGLIAEFRDLEVPLDTWVSHTFSLKDELPQAATIQAISVGGTGWSYAGQVDNIELIGVPGG